MMYIRARWFVYVSLTNELSLVTVWSPALAGPLQEVRAFYCTLYPSHRLHLAITIAIRYATVRRQGDPDAHGVERPVMQYPSTYYRLLPILSHAYVFILLGRQTVFMPAHMQLCSLY